MTDILKHLINTSYPLLQKLRESCPGTFKHSQAVASMVEGVSIELNLNVLFLKAAAIYHDIGKIYNPLYFIENQLEEDPHEDLDPFISYQIISRHVSDTALILLNDKNFSRELIETICQHHGTSVIKYFYGKSKMDKMENYRYKGEKPVSIEAALLMICDCLEAKMKADLQTGSTNNYKIIIEDIIEGLLKDGQLDEVVMRLGDLTKMKKALEHELEGSFQKRINLE